MLSEATGADPGTAFDNLLSEKLLQLSVTDRNNIQEEIHGVKCLAPEETPQLIEESLRKLANEIDNVIPNSQKRAYLRSQQRTASAAFVNSRDFRLRFLRCELFDYRKAAQRMVRVCDSLLDLFGTYALERPIKLADFTNAELKILRKGRVQPLPFRDRCGRRICILFPGAESLKEKGDENNARDQTRELQYKIFLYYSSVLGSAVDTQRRGIVFIIWFDAMLADGISKDIKRIQSNMRSHQVSMLRGSAVHILSPDTPFYRLKRSILSLGAGQLVSRLRIHLGNPIELRYILNGYGISADTIPISHTGTVKCGYLREWMRIRQHLEDPKVFEQICDEHSGEKLSRPIECPSLTDIVFKKGKSAKMHPGNAHFRSLIQLKYEHDRLAHSSKIASEAVLGKSDDLTLSLAEYFFNEVIQGHLRMLLWNEKQGWWSILTDEKHMRKKIENTVRGCIESADQNRSTPYQEQKTLPHEQAASCWFGSRQVEENSMKRRRLLGKNDSNTMFRDMSGGSEDDKSACGDQCFHQYRGCY